MHYWILPGEIFPGRASVSAVGFGPRYFRCHLGGRKTKVFYGETVQFWNVHNRIFLFLGCGILDASIQAESHYLVEGDPQPPPKGKQQHRRPTLVPKPPSLPVYVFPIPDKPSDKLRVVYECLAKLNSGRQDAKELRVHRNTLARMMERYRYPSHVQHITTDGK